jgi:NADPH:quinone reductase
MHRWQCNSPTGTDKLSWVTAPLPSPEPGEVLVAIDAASLNFPDLLIVEGKYQWQPQPPFTPGAEFAGTVVGLGPGTTDIAIGDAVMTVGTTGGFATHACVRADKLKPVPQGMSTIEASVLQVAYGTAYHGLMDRAALRAGETVLVLGAAGGVGTAAIQVACAAGARVIAAVSSDAKAAFCRRLGADLTINYTVENLREALRASTPAGPDVIFDPVGDVHAEPAFRSIAWRGRYLVIGFAGGQIPRLALNLALLKGASVTGVFWGEFDAREPKASRELIAALAGGHAAGWLRPVIDHIFPMTELPAAYAQLRSRSAQGKIVMTNGVPPTSCVDGATGTR